MRDAKKNQKKDKEKKTVDAINGHQLEPTSQQMLGQSDSKEEEKTIKAEDKIIR